MEAGGCTEPAEDNLPPDAFYVEEAQATLAHLKELGISELAERWTCSNPGTQVTVPQAPTNVKKKTDFFFNKSNSPISTPINMQNKKQEVTSILKRRSSDQGPLTQSGSLFSIPDDSELVSEDSISQGGYSERSEVSDEPVLGRRALREKNRNNFDGSDDDDSDIDDYRDGSQISMSSYDLSELRQSLLNDTGDIQPMQLTAGKELVLYHYVHLDSTEGIFLSPPECTVNSNTLDSVLSNFRESCQHIHKLFENTLRFKNLTPQDMANSVMNKSLIAIKEYGVLFETDYLDDNARKTCKHTFWVIGRLFHMPHPREIYVCYKDSVPQNLVEIAFKLGISMIVQ